MLSETFHSREFHYEMCFEDPVGPWNGFTCHSSLSLSASAAFDGSDVPACKGVTDVCMAANVSATDSKSGKAEHGYQPGEHKRDGEGLWVDCVAKLAKGETVAGVTGVTAAQAKACMQGERAAHPRK